MRAYRKPIEQTPGAQSAGALSLLAALYALAPAVLKIAAVALVWRFPIDREAQAALRARLDAPAA